MAGLLPRRRFLLVALGATGVPLAQACAVAFPGPATPTLPPRPTPTPTAVPRPTEAVVQIDGAPPTRPVELVISTNPGGASDIYARFIIGVVERQGLSPQPFLPVYREGAVGAVAMYYLATRQADPHAIMITLNSFIITPLVQELPFTRDSFTPIALLGLDPFFLWVTVESRFRDLDDFIDQAKQREIAVAGTGTRQEDEVLFKLIELRADTRPFRYVPFRGGGDVARALVGHRVEASVNNPSEALPFYPGRLRPLAAFLEQRSPAFPDLPTATELSLPITYANMRGIIAAPGITDEQRRWHTGLMQRVFETPDWQDFLAEHALEARFVGGDAFTRFLDDFEAQHKELITRAGWI